MTAISSPGSNLAVKQKDALCGELDFFNDTVEKAFVMLNIYAGFKVATQIAADSDPRTARRT
jgi:hypothetical protein